MKEGRPSATALLILRSTILVARDPALSVLAPPAAVEAARRLLEEIDPGWLAELRWQAASWSVVRSAAFFLERFVIPGISLHYAVRKRFIEDAARQALAAGARQVVVLGAGFDTLALRLHREFPEVLFVESDHPATQAVKRRALARWGELDANLKLVTLDLARSRPEEVLAAVPEYREEADTFLIAEGLTMYLQPVDLDALFAFLREHAGPGSRFVFTFMEPQAEGRIDFPSASPFVRPWLARVGEPFTWGIRRAELPAFLAARGFELADLAGAEELRQRYLAPAGLGRHGLAVGELVALARRVP
ncbi:MAG TPA: SAM-dependent methyltransferase [Thermoanaerobaculia bacterium]|nr:SAM-dependent methyltransferase [Thermoanaerobaculia bacterium]